MRRRDKRTSDDRTTPHGEPLRPLLRGPHRLKAGVPCVTVRFESADDLAASEVGRHVVDRVAALAVVETSRVTRRFGARWYPLR